MGLLYTPFKILHFPEKVNSLPKETETIFAPIHIRIKPTNTCNHNCYYCAYKKNDLQLGKDMRVSDQIPKNKMLEIISDLIDMNVQAVTFSGGGEPLIYPHILETIKNLADSPIKFATLTNGSYLTDEVAEIFSHHATWVRISIEGWDSKSYATYRKVPETEFDKVINNITNFKALNGKCFLGISLIIDHKNANHIENLVSRLKDTGVDSVKLSPCITSNNARENNEYHASIFNRVREEIESIKMSYTTDSFEIFDAYHELDEKFDKDYTWCPYLQILPVIGADTNVYSCHDKAYNLNSGLLGSIRERSFKDLWFSNKNMFFKINPSTDCNHHCAVNNSNQTIFNFMNINKEHLSFV